MSFLKDLKKELKDKEKLEKLGKKEKIALEQAWFNDHRDKGCQREGCEVKHPELMTIDHIIPKDLLRQLGVDIEYEFDEDNLEILCKRCNNFKSNRLDFANKKTKALLRKYVDQIT